MQDTQTATPCPCQVAPLTTPERHEALERIAERRRELELELEVLQTIERGHLEALEASQGEDPTLISLQRDGDLLEAVSRSGTEPPTTETFSSPYYLLLSEDYDQNEGGLTLHVIAGTPKDAKGLLGSFAVHSHSKAHRQALALLGLSKRMKTTTIEQPRNP